MITIKYLVTGHVFCLPGRDVIALQDNIELLRWLYKEDVKGE